MARKASTLRCENAPGLPDVPEQPEGPDERYEQRNRAHITTTLVLGGIAALIRKKRE